MFADESLILYQNQSMNKPILFCLYFTKPTLTNVIKTVRRVISHLYTGDISLALLSSPSLVLTRSKFSFAVAYFLKKGTNIIFAVAFCVV